MESAEYLLYDIGKVLIIMKSTIRSRILTTVHISFRANNGETLGAFVSNRKKLTLTFCDRTLRAYIHAKMFEKEQFCSKT